jgi:rhamnosyl/mannosyltransferase
MKILETVKLYTPWLGGVEKVAQDMAEDLMIRGHEVNVLCCQPKGKRESLRINGVKTVKSSSFGVFRGMPLSCTFIIDFLKASRDADVIGLHLPFPLADFALWLSNADKKIIVHYHSDIVRQKYLGKIVRPFLINTLNRADKIIVSNDNLVSNSKVLAPYKSKIITIPFGFDMERAMGFLNESRQKEFQDKYGNYVLFVGRLSYYKGVEYLIGAMKDVNANLLIVGKGDEKSKLLKLIRKNKMGTKVIFLEDVKDGELYNIMAAANSLVLPSIYPSEAFGLVLLEAMSLGTPAISTELGTGTSWINKDGETGFVVPPRNSEALCIAINEILNEPLLREKLSRQGISRAKMFGKTAMMDRVEKVYEQSGGGAVKAVAINLRPEYPISNTEYPITK